ncbi:unnamed protein product [Mesocestoides corti]|uniref:Vesicle transport protein n=1 Tax=Mesocestoides corti TaxID=53468 RepID=A0A3P6H513_MESCO|nr:unnamed protein product [Mesocestoides corti]
MGVLLTILVTFPIVSFVRVIYFSYCQVVESVFFTFFLMGPVNQCKRMFAKSRIIAASFVLVSCLLRSSTPLCLIFSILQSLSLTWYSLSFIPYAR